MTIDTFFDKIFYINLPRDIERNNNILKQLKNFNISNYERVEGIVVNELPEENLYRNFNNKEDKKYILGSLGCRSTHIKIIKESILREYNRILILEDDITFLSNPNNILNGNILNVIGADLIYFGGLQEQHFRNQIVQTHAMGLSNGVYKDILCMAESSGMEIDNFYAKVLQQMSVNNRVGGQYIVKKMEPFNSIIQNNNFISNIK